jgi:hypothetical protein
MEYCPQCGVRDPAGYNIQALAVDQAAGRKRSSYLVPFLGLVAILAMIGLYVAGPAPNKQNGTDATTQKPNDDPEKAELIKRMRDAVMARHHGVMPETSSEADTKVMLDVSKKWLAEKTKSKLDAMKVKPPPSSGFAEIMLAKEGITKMLRDPDSGVFDDVSFYNDRKSENGYYVPVVCGTVNARNGFGGMSGPKHFFAVVSDVASGVMLEGTTPQNVFAPQWNKYCAGPHG